MEQKRKALIERNTSETNISLELNIDGKANIIITQV